MYELKTFAPGETIIQEGTVDNRLYVLQDGTIDVIKGDTKVVELDTKGLVLGEISVILGTPRSTTVKAKTEVDMLEFAMSIEEIIEKNPHLTKRILTQLAMRLEKTTANLASKD